MSDRTETDKKADQDRPTPVRRPWHAPHFFSTDVAATDTVGNAGTDGGPMGSAS